MILTAFHVLCLNGFCCLRLNTQMFIAFNYFVFLCHFVSFNYLFIMNNRTLSTRKIKCIALVQSCRWFLKSFVLIFGRKIPLFVLTSRLVKAFSLRMLLKLSVFSTVKTILSTKGNLCYCDNYIDEIHLHFLWHSSMIYYVLEVWTSFVTFASTESRWSQLW